MEHFGEPPHVNEPPPALNKKKQGSFIPPIVYNYKRA